MSTKRSEDTEGQGERERERKREREREERNLTGDVTVGRAIEIFLEFGLQSYKQVDKQKGRSIEYSPFLVYTRKK